MPGNESLEVILADQKYLIEKRNREVEMLAILDQQIAISRKTAIQLISNGETTGSMLKDAILGTFGYIEPVIEEYFLRELVPVDPACFKESFNKQLTYLVSEVAQGKIKLSIWHRLCPTEDKISSRA